MKANTLILLIASCNALQLRPAIGLDGFDAKVGNFLEDLNLNTVIPPNLGFVQLKEEWKDHYDDDFHPDFPTGLPPNSAIKPVKGVSYKTAQ